MKNNIADWGTVTPITNEAVYVQEFSLGSGKYYVELDQSPKDGVAVTLELGSAFGSVTARTEQTDSNPVQAGYFKRVKNTENLPVNLLEVHSSDANLVGYVDYTGNGTIVSALSLHKFIRNRVTFEGDLTVLNALWPPSASLNGALRYSTTLGNEWVCKYINSTWQWVPNKTIGLAITNTSLQSTIAKSDNVTVTLNNPVAVNHRDNTHFKIQTNPEGVDVSVAVTPDETGAIITINPDSDLTVGSNNYKLAVADTTMDIYGNALGSTFEQIFGVTTVDLAPTWANTNPITYIAGTNTQDGDTDAQFQITNICSDSENPVGEVERYNIYIDGVLYAYVTGTATGGYTSSDTNKITVVDSATRKFNVLGVNPDSQKITVKGQDATSNVSAASNPIFRENFKTGSLAALAAAGYNAYWSCTYLDLTAGTVIKGLEAFVAKCTDGVSYTAMKALRVSLYSDNAGNLGSLLAEAVYTPSANDVSNAQTATIAEGRWRGGALGTPYTIPSTGKYWIALRPGTGSNLDNDVLYRGWQSAQTGKSRRTWDVINGVWTSAATADMAMVIRYW